MKKKVTVYLDNRLVSKLREILNIPPRKSLSFWIETKIKEELELNKAEYGR